MARRRLALMTVLAVVALGVVGWRLVQLQVVGNARYESLAMAQRLDTVPIPAQRGSIFDRNGTDLAVSVRTDSIWANPQVVTDPAGYAAQLAPIVGGDEAVLAERLADRSRQFVYVARTVEEPVADAVRDLRLPGVDFLPESKRYYPAGDLAGPVLGVVGTDDAGLGGIELRYDEELSGTPGELVLERGRDGRAIPRTVRHEVPAQRGTDLVVTLDQSLQYAVEQSLADQVTAVAAEGGVAVVLDVRTGNVLAMASVLAGDDGIGRPASQLERNRVVTDPYEPGSTSKLLTYAAALDAGVVGPDTVFEVPDWIQIDDRSFTDSEPHPTLTLTTRECFAMSSNVCTIKIAEALGAPALHDALERFGLGRPTGIGFPGEAAGTLRDPGSWYRVGLASAAIGYGLSVTPMHMLDAFTTIANGGSSRPPRLVAATIGPDGARVEVPLAPEQRVVSEPAAAVLRSVLADVVTSGTGTCAAVRGYTVAGKTGTARKFVDGGYSNQRFFASFAGFAPAEDPRLAAIVVIDEPDYDHRYGGRAAAPVFAEIMQFALRLERVPPPPVGGAEQWEIASAAAAEAGIDCTVPHGGALDQLVAARGATGAGGSAGPASDGSADPATAGATPTDGPGEDGGIVAGPTSPSA
jgi:cell division protein FtsI (penicillin-binding protein 3)